MQKDYAAEIKQLEAVSKDYTMRADALRRELTAAKARLAQIALEKPPMNGAALLEVNEEWICLHEGIRMIQSQVDELRRRAGEATLRAWRAVDDNHAQRMLK